MGRTAKTRRSVRNACPGGQRTVNLSLSNNDGGSGFLRTYEPKRYKILVEQVEVPCYSLAALLREQARTEIDYMTIDTEGSELDIVRSFPWDEFTVRLVQIELLHARTFPAHACRREAITSHLVAHGYTLLRTYVVAPRNTDDLMFTLDRSARRSLQGRHHERLGPSECH